MNRIRLFLALSLLVVVALASPFPGSAQSQGPTGESCIAVFCTPTRTIVCCGSTEQQILDCANLHC